MIVDVDGNESFVVEHAIGLAWRGELWVPDIGLVDVDILEELQRGVSKAYSDVEKTTHIFEWVIRWLPMFRHGIRVLLHSSVPGDCSTIVTGEVILMEMR